MTWSAKLRFILSLGILFSSSRDSYLNSCSVSVRKNSLASAMGRKRGDNCWTVLHWENRTRSNKRRKRMSYNGLYKCMSVCYQNATIIQGIIVLGHTVHHAWIVLQSSQELVQSCESWHLVSSLSCCGCSVLQALNLILCFFMHTCTWLLPWSRLSV